jgi:hypothetical protein
LKFEIRSTKSETNPNVKYQMLETGASDRLVRYPRVSGERRVFGCLFWTFEFAKADPAASSAVVASGDESSENAVFLPTTHEVPADDQHAFLPVSVPQARFVSVANCRV